MSAPIAERYVRLVLAVGRHDPDYVDAYYGPDEWRPDPADPPLPLDALRGEAGALRAAIEGPDGRSLADERRACLSVQLRAVESRLRMLAGERLTFDEESRVLYDAVAPTHGDEHFERARRDLETRLPGDGPLVDRYDRYRAAFAVPPDRLAAVFARAIGHARAVTRAHVVLTVLNASS